MSNVWSFRRLLLALCKRSEGVYARRVLKQLHTVGLTPALFASAPEPDDYTDPEDFWEDYQIFSLVSKAPIDFGGIDRVRAAQESFLAAEKLCFHTNRRFDRYLHDVRPNGPAEWRFWEFLLGVKDDISRLLGYRLPDTLVPEFTPGATMSDKHDKTTIFDKLSSVPTYYPQAAELLLLTRHFMWEEAVNESSSTCAPRLVKHNSWFSVPKKWDTDRGCAKEASFNVVCQRAIGLLFRRRLKKWGIDLRHGARVHQFLARKGSETGEWATIDLKQASDCLARNVVRVLLPEEWYDLLDALRAPKTSMGGKTYLLEKFSSMGNGFTFELETLVFAAVCRNVCRLAGMAVTDVHVYGDDIIVPVHVAEACINALSAIGFQTNVSKTYVAGPFRESCGGDYFEGVRVNPVRLKKEPVSPPDWMALHNELLRACQGKPRRLRFTSGLRALCFSAVPVPIRSCMGPSHLGNIVFHTEEYPTKLLIPRGTGELDKGVHPVRHVKAVLPQNDSLEVFSKSGVPRWGNATTLAAVLLGADSKTVYPRGEPTGYKIRWVPCDGLSDIDS